MYVHVLCYIRKVQKMLELFFFLHSASYETIFDYRVKQDGFKMQGTSLKQFNFESGVLVHNHI